MLYLLSERSAAKLRKLLGDMDAVVPATPAPTRRTRPDVPPMVGGGTKDRGIFRLEWRKDEDMDMEHVLYVGPGAYIVGRRVYQVADETYIGQDFTGWITLKVTIGAEAETVVTGAVADPFNEGEPSGNVSYYPLWYIDEDYTATDYRATPVVQAWE